MFLFVETVLHPVSLTCVNTSKNWPTAWKSLGSNKQIVTSTADKALIFFNAEEGATGSATIIFKGAASLISSILAIKVFPVATPSSTIITVLFLKLIGSFIVTKVW